MDGERGADGIVEEQRLGGMVGDDGRCCTALVTLLQVIVTHNHTSHITHIPAIYQDSVWTPGSPHRILVVCVLWSPRTHMDSHGLHLDSTGSPGAF